KEQQLNLCGEFIEHALIMVSNTPLCKVLLTNITPLTACFYIIYHYLFCKIAYLPYFCTN
ncbi:MAG: hypothetical protein D8H98_14050, partial [Prevotella sp.]